MKNKKYPLWYYGVLFLLPIILISILEVSLRVSNYGNNYDVFVKISDQFENLLFFNPKLPQKYFSDVTTVPSVIPDGFEKIKRKNSFRIFVFGGSSTAGYPYPPNASFSRQLKRKLEIVYPNVFWEVINLGVSAINSNTINDIFDDVIDQKPDLIILYTGHNEYYGADGAASSNIFSGNPTLVSFQNYLRNQKIYQFLNNFVKLFASNKDPQKPSGTLMAQMAGDNLVPMNSEVYNSGISQFEENLNSILIKSKENNLEVFLCTLVSNLKQEPLDKMILKESEAVKLFDEAMNSSENEKSKKLFIDAKEKDSFRFRAPNKINEIISKMADSYNYNLIDIEKSFSRNSENGITDFNLFVDHLHPNIEGYKLISDLLFNNIIELPFFEQEKRTNIDSAKLDEILKSSFPFSRLDSTYSKIKIDILLNSYPFEEKISNTKLINKYLLSENKTDKIAAQIINRNLSWEKAHSILAEEAYSRNDFYNFFREMWVLIEDKPFEKTTYVYAVQKLLDKRELNLARIILLKYNSNYEDSFSTKKLGELYGEMRKFQTAINYLNKSLIYDKNDPETFFKLSIYLSELQDFTNALEAVNQCLQISHNYKNAKTLQKKLEDIISNSQ